MHISNLKFDLTCRPRCFACLVGEIITEAYIINLVFNLRL